MKNILSQRDGFRLKIILISLIIAVFIFISSGDFLGSLGFTFISGAICLFLILIFAPHRFISEIISPIFVVEGLAFGIPGILSMLILILLDVI